MRPPYLTGNGIYLRAMAAADQERATAWYAGPFPINATRAEAILKEAHQRPWNPPDLMLAMVRGEDDAVIGGAVIHNPIRRRGQVELHLAPGLTLAEADGWRAAALRLLVPWLRDELEMMVLTVGIGADEVETVAAAEALGMVQAARFRQHLARPGGRVDLLWYQALNPRRGVGDA